MKNGADGVVVAAPIWNAFMKRALEGKPVEQFKKPKANTAKKPVLLGKLQGDVQVFVDSETGKQIPDSCLASWPSAFVREVSVKEVHTILYYLDKDDPNGAAPADPTKDPMYANWEKPIEAWAKKNNYVAKAPAMESCDLRAGQGTTSVSILSPTSNTTVTSASLAIEVGTSADTVSVQYTVDGTVVASISAAPFSTTLDLSAQENGFHTIRAIATTSAGTTGSSTITINLLVKDSGAVQYFITPAPNSTVPSNSFPRTVKIFAYDPAGVIKYWTAPESFTSKLIVIVELSVVPAEVVAIARIVWNPFSCAERSRVVENGAAELDATTVPSTVY
jgi:hypothetical protein